VHKAGVDVLHAMYTIQSKNAPVGVVWPSGNTKQLQARCVQLGRAGGCKKQVKVCALASVEEAIRAADCLKLVMQGPAADLVNCRASGYSEEALQAMAQHAISKGIAEALVKGNLAAVMQAHLLFHYSTTCCAVRSPACHQL